MEAERGADSTAVDLAVPERVLLFCLACDTDRQKAGQGQRASSLPAQCGFAARERQSRSSMPQPSWVPLSLWNDMVRPASRA
jgi:hypothetical protein